MNALTEAGQRLDFLDQELFAICPGVAILLTTTRVTTWRGTCPLSSAGGFFFRTDSRLYLVTSRHVLIDLSSGHSPDRVEIELHTDARDLTRFVVYSIPLYRNGLGLWRQAGHDEAGPVDVAIIEIELDRLPYRTVLQPLAAAHLDPEGEDVTVGDALTVIGYPLGFHDTVHHLPVARSAAVASAYGMHFQRKQFFLTDARTHSGSSGSPVFRRRGKPGSPDDSARSWQLLGIHSTRMDMRTRDHGVDESLGLNCAWYATVLTALTREAEQRH